MQTFQPDEVTTPSGHFIGGRRLVHDAPRLQVKRPSDAQPHAGLPLADVATVDAAVRDAWAAWRHTDWARRAPRERARVLRRISAGTVWINRYGRSNDFVIPTVGYHQSGIGKDLGRQSVESNLRFKSVLIDFAGDAGPLPSRSLPLGGTGAKRRRGRTFQCVVHTVGANRMPCRGGPCKRQLRCDACRNTPQPCGTAVLQSHR